MSFFKSRDNWSRIKPAFDTTINIMLQSPKPRIQRQQQQLRRLTSAPDNPVLEAKQDTQRRVQRPTSSLRQNASINTAQRGSPRKQQHRRNLSVPDNILMSIASASAQGGTHGDYKFYQNTLDDAGCDSMNSASDRRRPMENINTDHAFFLQQMQHGPRTAPIQMEASGFQI